MKERVYNKNLKFEGWNQMKSILDKEMPEKKRKKIAFFFPIAAGLIFFLGVYILFTNQITSKKQISNKELTVNSTKLEIQNKKNKTNPLQVSKSITSKNDTKLIAPKNKLKKAKANIKTTFETKSAYFEEKSGSTVANILQPREKLISGLIKTETINKSEKIKNIVYADNISIPNINPIIRFNSGYLPKLNSNIITPRKKSGFSLINPFLTAKMFSFVCKDSKPSLSFELGNRTNIGNRFFVDLSLDYYKTRLIISELRAEGAKYSVIDAQPNELSKDTLYYYDKYTFDDKIFEVVLSPGYRINKRLSTRIGFGALYIAKSVNKIKDKVEDRKNYYDNKVIDQLFTKKYILSTEFSLEYKVLKHFSFNIGYKYFYFEKRNGIINEPSLTVKSEIKPISNCSRFYAGAKIMF